MAILITRATVAIIAPHVLIIICCYYITVPFPCQYPIFAFRHKKQQKIRMCYKTVHSAHILASKRHKMPRKQRIFIRFLCRTRPVYPSTRTRSRVTNKGTYLAPTLRSPRYTHGGCINKTPPEGTFSAFLRLPEKKFKKIEKSP